MDMLEKLKEILKENPNLIKDLIKEEDLIKERRYNRISKILESFKSEKELDDWLNYFFTWEEKFENMKRDKHFELTSSNIFDALCDYSEKNMDKEFDLYEDFLSFAYSWKKYMFKLYVGQGCFWRVYKDDKLIFQTT
jgi:hypothetical protein